MHTTFNSASMLRLIVCPLSHRGTLTWSGKTMHFWFRKWEPLSGTQPRSLHKLGWNLGCLKQSYHNTITCVLFSYIVLNANLDPHTTMAILQNRTYDPPSLHLWPWNPNVRSSPGQPLRLSKVAPTTLKSPSYKAHLDPPSSTFDPPKFHLRPSNPHVRSSPTTLQVPPTTLQSCAYNPEIPMSEAHLRPSKSHPQPSKVAPTTLKSPCQELTTTLFALWLLASVVWKVSCQNACLVSVASTLQYSPARFFSFHCKSLIPERCPKQGPDNTSDCKLSNFLAETPGMQSKAVITSKLKHPARTAKLL